MSDPGDDRGRGRFALPDFLSSSKEVATKSVMSPLQWMMAITAAAGVFGAVFIPDPVLRWVAFLPFAATTAYALFAYDFFRGSDPDKLQSESYRHAQSRLQHDLLLDERHQGQSQLLAVTPVANSAAHALASPVPQLVSPITEDGKPE